MEIKISQSELSQRLLIVSKAIASKSPQSILTGIKICANQIGVLEITAYDLELGITTQTDAVEVLESGEIVLVGKYVTELVKKLPAGTITLQSVNGSLDAEILRGKARYQINGMNPADFPKLPEFIGKSAVQMSSEAIRHLILSTAFAASKLQARPEITGVHVSLDSGVAHFEATDGARLGMSSVPVPEYPDLRWDVIVPARTFGVILRQLPEEGTVQFQISGSHAMVGADNVYYYTRLLVGDYPDVSHVVTGTPENFAVVDGTDLFRAVDRALLATDGENAPVTLNFSQDYLEIFSHAVEVGKTQEVVDIKLDKGPTSIGCNGRYLLDALRAAENQGSVRIEFYGARRPFAVKGSQEGDLQIISPYLLK